MLLLCSFEKKKTANTDLKFGSVHAAHEIMAVQGLGQVYPPKLIANIPKPRDEKERHTYLVGLFHAAECAMILGETQEELARYKNVAMSIGGDPDSNHYGGNIDKVFPAVVTI